MTPKTVQRQRSYFGFFFRSCTPECRPAHRERPSALSALFDYNGLRCGYPRCTVSLQARIRGGTANAFYGLSGAGDLILTCYSEHSRNHSVGKRLGEGEPLPVILNSTKTVAEGIPTARSAWECARRLNIATPITDQVYSILYKQKKPAVALEELLKREPKPEQG